MANDQDKEDWLKVLGVNFPRPDQPASARRVDRAQADREAANHIAVAKSAYPSPPPPAHIVSAADNAALSTMDAATLRNQNLTQRDTKELFSDKYMSGLVGLKMKGANDAKLKDIMRKLSKGVTAGDRKTLIAELAKIRGGNAAQLDMEYDRFLILRAQQQAVAEDKKEEPVPDLAEDIHDTFQASNAQLVYGKVVGDAFGVDPVFGAMLNPTGGLVGPGNYAVQLDDDSPTCYHGIVHDAAGYFVNYHNQGPGYDYLGKEASKGHDTKDPLTGQQSGMRYWHEKLDPGVGTKIMCGVIDVISDCKDVYSDAKKLPELIKEGASKEIDDVKIKTEKALETGRKIVSNAIDKAITTATTAAKTAETALEQTAHEAAAAATQAATKVANTASTTYNAAKNAIGSAGAAVKEKLGAAWSFVMGD